MKKTVSILGVFAALAVAATVYALPASEVETFYFSDATLTEEVGYQILACSGARYREGQVTRHSARIQTPCHSTGLPRIACMVNGTLTTCPADICNSGLFSCS
jgi:hypothetical protein